MRLAYHEFRLLERKHPNCPKAHQQSNKEITRKNAEFVPTIATLREMQNFWNKKLQKSAEID